MAERLCLSYRDALVAIYSELGNSVVTDISGGEYKSIPRYQSRAGKIPEIRIMLSTKYEVRS